MTFLELCQRAASESGTVSGEAQPAAVTGQTGRLAKVVGWVKSAWDDIQRERDDWRWMRADFEGQTLASVDTYAASAFSLTRWSQWRLNMHGDSGISIYKQSEGANDERALRAMEWQTFRAHYLRGVHSNGFPDVVSIDPQGRLRFYPKPDDVYVVRGEYQMAPQTLAANSDTPEMPSQFHMLIVWRALGDYLAVDDEAMGQLPLWRQRAAAIKFDLVRSQTPPMTFAEPWV